MKVLQINAVYEKYSTGRTTKELHEELLKMGIESYIACPDLSGLKENAYKIGNKLDRKMHAFFSRVSGKQGYFSRISTKKLIKYIDQINPDIVFLRNLHGNYINVPMLLKYLARNNKAVIITLHDCWFYTGKCVDYIDKKCDKWMYKCGSCPSIKDGNKSLFFDKSESVLLDKKELFNDIDRLAVVGVSQWVTNDAKKSILKNAKVIKCIYNWIDLELFKPYCKSMLREKLGLKDKFIILGIATNWNKCKGIDVFNKLADELSEEYKIILVGNKETIEVKNPKIKYLGIIHDVHELAELYSAADVFVNPSTHETFGKTTAEAISCGTPVIAYNGTATPELIGVDEKCGYLINENDSQKYIEKIEEIHKIGKSVYEKECRKRAEMLFNKEKNIEEYIKLMSALKND